MGRLHLLWNLYQLKRNEHKSREQIRILQDKKLRKLLYHAYDHSTYYRRTFEQAGITREQIKSLPLSAFPAIDKKILMEYFDEIVTKKDIVQEKLRKFDEENSVEQKEFLGKYHVVHSSGSTGVPRYFVYDTSAWNQMLLGIIRGALWNMTMPQILKLLSGRLRILYIAATDGRYGGAMAVGDGIDGVGAEQMFLDINTPLSEWTRSVKEFKPDIIIGYPSAIKILGELVERSEVSVNVCRVISCGEPLPLGMRNYLEQIFKTVIVNFYGASESLALGVETNPAEGMYLFDDMNYIEVENGQMYLTSLYNFTQPLIRYRISDQLTLKKPDDMSRYPFLQTDILLSRNEDVLWFEDSEGKRDFLHPLAVEGLCVEGLLDYQFRQTDKDAFEMLAEVSRSQGETRVRREILQQMERILHEKNLDNVRFFVRFTKEILPDSRTGKKQLIVQWDGGS
ncbi:MAG: phenylacetate--CoA ligase family protein [Lachnospiraceae bacterium]|nr:phenylacetate--CoA ligase family protein [Lachnospiraceae bacterium]